jgi:hypothetical protein
MPKWGTTHPLQQFSKMQNAGWSVENLVGEDGSLRVQLGYSMDGIMA